MTSGSPSRHLEPVDVAILGGGPAGSAAGRLLAGWGHSVTLIARPSAYGALAESIPPTCRKLFDLLGVTRAIEESGFLRTTGNTVWWGGESRTGVFADRQLGFQVRRDALEAFLLNLAEQAGARVLRNATARAVSLAEGDGSAHTVRYDATTPSATATSARTSGGDALDAAHPLHRASADDSQAVVTARWVLDASGRAGVVARRGFRRAEPALRTTAIAALYERPGWGLDDESHTLVESYENGWAWSVPISRTLRCFAVMVDPTLTELTGRSRLEEAYSTEVSKAQRFRTLLEDLSASVAPFACDATPYGAHRVTDVGVLLVGDAASFVDPLSSYGIKKALASGWLAAVVVHTCLADPHMTTPALQFYEARERAMYGSLQRASTRFARAAADGHAHEFWLERGTADASEESHGLDPSALRRDPDILSAFDELRVRDAIDLTPTATLQRKELPVVRGNRIALASHLIVPAFPDGIRYIRDVDLVKLVELAGDFRQVPDLYDAYNRAAPPVALPDFLGALSLLLGKGFLEQR